MIVKSDDEETATTLARDISLALDNVGITSEIKNIYEE
jgi:hypothetical protein